jgi:hypothetical protein
MCYISACFDRKEEVSMRSSLLGPGVKLLTYMSQVTNLQLQLAKKRLM